MAILGFKSATTLLTIAYIIQKLQELPIEILFIHVAQEAATLLEVKFEV